MIFKHSHRRTERRLHQMFVEGISDVERRRLLAEVETCEHCRAACRTWYKTEAALSFAGTAGSPFAVERMAKGIFGAQSVPKTSARPVSVKVAAALVPIAALAVAALFLLPNSKPFRIALPRELQDNAVELVSRGGAVSRGDAVSRGGAASWGGAASSSPDFGFRAFAVSRENRRIQENSRISMNDLLTFTYTRTNPTKGYLALFGIQNSGDVIWYYPDFGEALSVEIRGDRVDEPLGDGFNISANHESGPLLMVALFSEKPISSRSIETLADEQMRRNERVEQWSSDIFKEIGKDVTAYSILSTVEDNHD